MTGSANSKIKLYWDHFFRAETGTYEKTTWLELFLAEFLLQLKEGADPLELISFCPVSGVATLVGCELLCGVHRVSSSINTHFSFPPPAPALPPHQPSPLPSHQRSELNVCDEALEGAPLADSSPAQSSLQILQRHLLRGYAWKCLLLLKSLGVEGVSCCRQLGSVLVWLYGELGAASPPPPHGPAPPHARPNPHLPSQPPPAPVHHLFSDKIWSKHKHSGSALFKSGSAGSDKQSPFLARSKKKSTAAKTPAESSDDRMQQKPISSDSDHHPDNDLEVLNRTISIKARLNDEFEYFESPQPEDSARFRNFSPRRTRHKPKAEDYITEKHREIIDSEISIFEFSIIVIDLLTQLCKAESSLSGSEGQQISVQCINFSLRNLCALQFGSSPVPSSQYTVREVSQLKACLTDLLIISLDKVLVKPDFAAKVATNGILPMLLRLLEDVTYKLNLGLQGECEADNKTVMSDIVEAESIARFLFGIGYSITVYMYCLCVQSRSLDKLKELSEHIKLYSDCQKGVLLKECISLLMKIPGLEEEVIVSQVKKLIYSIGRLINGIKRIRSEVVHSSTCPRSKHKVCRKKVGAGMHHHHSILGEPLTNLGMSTACCVSVIFSNLTSLTSDNNVISNSALRHKTLRVMLQCGLCCCFPSNLLVENVVRLMLKYSNTANLCLHVLEYAVYGELGANILKEGGADQIPCQVCEPTARLPMTLEGVKLSDSYKESFKRYYSKANDKNITSFLIHYNSLLQVDNHSSVLHATVNHLLKVMPKCRQEVKQELLFSVIYPTFIVAKHRYLIRNEEAAFFLTASCLNIFASLLNTVSFAEQFIQKGGLSYVLELVSKSEFSKQCCSILEIAITVEIFKLDVERITDLKELQSVRMLLTSLEHTVDLCYKLCKIKLPTDEFVKLTDLNVEKNLLNLCKATSWDNLNLEHGQSTPILIQHIPGSMGENTYEVTIDNHVEVLKNIWTFWNTCACLCLYSPKFRLHLVNEPLFVESYRLVKVLLYYLCQCDCAPEEAKTLTKIMEALLTVQFSVSDVTMDKSKAVSLQLLQEALLSDKVLGSDGESLKAICEMLIRVATACASPHQVMPPPTNTKLPPLSSAPHSDVECSSSDEERSLGGPYASELDEPAYHTADEGYEADVELGRFDAYSQRTYKISSVDNSPAHKSSAADSGQMGCEEYTRSGFVSHPELCIMVVDVLTQLIRKLIEMEAEGSGGSERMGRLGVALARACCARLAGALAHSPGPHHAPSYTLIHRLLTDDTAALLMHTSPHLQELQRSILDLVQVLASQSILPSELACYLRVFTAPRPPLTPLLNTLAKLVDAVQHNIPDFILCFPVERYSLDELESGVSAGKENGEARQGQGGAQPSPHAEALAKRLQLHHLQAGVRSCWSACGVRCGAEGAGWGAWLQGFAAAAWLHLHPYFTERGEGRQGDSDTSSQTGDERAATLRSGLDSLHLLSVGHESMMLELWLDTANAHLTFKLSRPESSANKVLSEVTVDTGMPLHQWNFLAFNAKEIVQKKKIYIQVTIFVNGCECETISLPIQGILVRKIQPLSLLIGQSLGPGEAAQMEGRGFYYLSGVSLFRAPILNRYSALYLTALGPNASMLNSCLIRDQAPNYPSLLTPTVLNSNFDWDQVYVTSSVNIRDIQESLLLTYCAHSAALLNLYHQTVSLPTVLSGRVTSSHVLAGGGGGGSGATSIPETLAVTWTGRPLSSRNRGIAPAAYMLGAPDTFLYLYARVVELDSSAEEQAKALSILLKLCYVDNRLYCSFYGGDCLSMLHTVMASPRCIISHHLLKALLDAACNSPVLVCSGGRFYLQMRCDAILIEPHILVTIIRAWRDLERIQASAACGCERDAQGAQGGRGVRDVQGAQGVQDVQYPPSVWMYERLDGSEGGLLGTLLLAMHVLLRDDHPHRTHNAYQMNRVDIIRHLLLYCKERSLSSEAGALSDTSACSLVELVRALMGAPPPLAHLALVMDFLLLMHQASETFVTHSRANFYFLLTPETQPNDDNHILSLNLPFISKRKGRKSTKSKKKSTLTPSVTADPGIALRDISNKKTSTSSMDDTSSIDAGSGNADKHELSEDRFIDKHAKGIINSQIKQGLEQKKSKRSSGTGSDISELENSDAQFEGSGDLSATEQQMIANEYVVIDSDEVDKTTVEMYSSGIFHQSRVLGGAAPGCVACEGLLLLLRDTINVMPDTTLAQVVGVVIAPETLLVLGNRREGSVRAGVVRVACALARRCSADELRRLEAAHYFVQLANQVALYPACYELVAACATLLTGCDATIEDQLEEDVWAEVSEKALCRSGPLVALLPCALHDVPLAHNLTLLIKKLINKASLKLLNEVGVAEVVIRSLRALGEAGDGAQTGEQGAVGPHAEGRELLLEDLRSLLVDIALKALVSQHSLQTIMELHYQLWYVEATGHGAGGGAGGGAAREARHAHTALYDAQLDAIETRLSSTAAKPHNYFATVLSSAVSLGEAGAQQSLSKSELAARHRAIVLKAVNFIITRDPCQEISNAEILLVERLFITLLNAVAGQSSSRSKWWGSGGDEWRAPLQELFLWLVAPPPQAPLTLSAASCLRARLYAFALRQLYHAPPHAHAALAPSDPGAQRKMAVYVLCALQLLNAQAGAEEALESLVLAWARNWAVSLQGGLAQRLAADALHAEAARHALQDAQHARALAAQSLPHLTRSVFSKEALASKVTEGAMAITRQVVDVQNRERKAFMDHLRRAQGDTVAATHKWQNLIDRYTHERALWHDAASYPKSWELDPTEGPGRVRVRLRRTHLNIDKRFLKESARHKLEGATAPAPLSYLTRACTGAGGGAGGGGGSSACALHMGLLERLHTNESVQHMARATYVTVATERAGDVLLTDRCIHFVPEQSEGGESARAHSWATESVRAVATRRWCLRERALELFLSSGHAHLLAFHTAHDMAAFLAALNNAHLPHRCESETLTEAMGQWRAGTLTNWEYLMRLNGWAGRSYNDLMQYPVLPFVLADYTSKILDLTALASFRDLRKPMAVQDKKNEQHYINNYNYLKQARRESGALVAGVNKEPYHYGSHYSNSGTVLHFLVRLPPFTALFLNYQDNNFDIPDRTFHSLQTTWRLTSCDSTTDVKELIPEFYYLPEFLNNNEGLELGVRQCGVPVEEVELPPWAPDARLFTLIHRQALESALATEGLPHWIDLVFGYKQTGQPAVDAINVFHPATYYGFEPAHIEDSVERLAWETMVRTYGQTPRQLLSHAHPHRAADLAHAPQPTISPWEGVVGARWGSYCGSPMCAPPVLVLARALPGRGAAHVAAGPAPGTLLASGPRARVLPLPHDAPAHASAASPAPSHHAGAAPLALLSWGHSDCTLRLKTRRDDPPTLLMHLPPIDQITCVSLSGEWGGRAWLGLAGGRVLALRVWAAGAPNSAAVLRAHVASLHAHRAPLTAVHACRAFGVAVTASADGLILVWDMHKLGYVRTLPNKDMLAVCALTVSETLCDVASAHELPAERHNRTDDELAGRYRAVLRVHTINGAWVGSVKVVERVTCVCYSRCAEGVSVNAVAAGLGSGGVRLYSSWDLRPIGYIAPHAPSPLTSIAYSVDSAQLYAGAADGAVYAWESAPAPGARPSTVRLLSAHSIF